MLSRFLRSRRKNNERSIFKVLVSKGRKSSNNWNLSNKSGSQLVRQDDQDDGTGPTLFDPSISNAKHDDESAVIYQSTENFIGDETVRRVSFEHTEIANMDTMDEFVPLVCSDLTPTSTSSPATMVTSDVVVVPDDKMIRNSDPFDEVDFHLLKEEPSDSTITFITDDTVPCSSTYYNKDPNIELVEDSKYGIEEGLILLDDVCANTTPSSADFITGRNVEIIGGIYKGKIAVIVRTTDKMVWLRIPEDNNDRKIRKENVKVILQPTYINNETALQQETNEELRTGMTVDVIGGVYSGCTSAVILKITAKMVRLKIPGEEAERLVKKDNVRPVALPHINSDHADKIILSDDNNNHGVDPSHQEGANYYEDHSFSNCVEADEFKISDTDNFPFRLGRFYTVRIVASIKKPDASCFLSHQWGGRLVFKDVTLKEGVSIEAVLFQHGYTMSLVSCKSYSETKSVIPFAQTKQQILRAAYAVTSGPTLQPKSVEQELLRIADFSSLSTRATIARLELLQTPAHQFNGKAAVRVLDATNFCEIEDSGHVGCGFISEDMLYRVCGATPTAKAIICIQVRLIIPCLGIYKGMLMRKIMKTGPPVQLPSSMRKVGPSNDPTYHKVAFFLICKAGVDPSNNNKYMGRLPSLNSHAKPPPRSFRSKPLSPMIKRLFKGLAVSNGIVEEYARRSLHNSDLNHAFIRGVADPTGKLPYGSVYLTGVTNKNVLGNELFVTRTPCLKCSDAQLISVIKECPPNMDKHEWEWLESLPFGALVFPFPRKGKKPLPEMIARGDLDGDRYFVCWNKSIVNQVVVDVIDSVSANVKDIVEINRKANWFEDVQRTMIDAGTQHHTTQLIGKLYTLSVKAADESALFMRDPDSEAFADAYYEMLDHAKHGTVVELPAHLYDRIPEHLRKFIKPRFDRL